jgi:L-alanine-DL-glutamate epimerase-like enolase superfamily enzyme
MFIIIDCKNNPVIPKFQIHEHHVNAIKPGNREICIQDYQPQKGRYAIPDLPGLGLDLNETVISQSPCVMVK